MPTSYQCALCGQSSFNPLYQTTHVCQSLVAQIRQANIVQFQPPPGPAAAYVASQVSATAV